MIKDDSELIYEAYSESDEEYSVKITMNEKDKYNAFVKFMEDIAHLADIGASREIGITDASDENERDMKFFVDGDGNTRLKVEKC